MVSKIPPPRVCVGWGLTPKNSLPEKKGMWFGDYVAEFGVSGGWGARGLGAGGLEVVGWGLEVGACGSEGL